VQLTPSYRGLARNHLSSVRNAGDRLLGIGRRTIWRTAATSASWAQMTNDESFGSKFAGRIDAA
jgi:hypothetical protein